MKKLMISTFLFILYPLSLQAGEWHSWLLNSNDGQLEEPRYAYGAIGQMQIRTQSGHGIVNMRMRYPDPDGNWHWSDWATTRHLGVKRSIKGFKDAEIKGIEVQNRHGQGIVNMRVRYALATGGEEWSHWFTHLRGINKVSQECSGDTFVQGMQARRSTGTGISNIRLYCTKPS